MSRLNDAHEHFDKAFKSGIVADIQAAADAWKAIAEAEKAEADIIRAPAKSERLRFWIPIVATLISSTSLVCAFVFQVYQFQKTNRIAQNQIELSQATLKLQMDQAKTTTEMANEAAEDTSFRNVLEKVASHMDGGPQLTIGLTLMKPFLVSGRYKRAAREITVSLLGHMVEPDSFKGAVRELGQRTEWENLEDLPTIARNLQAWTDEDVQIRTNAEARVEKLEDEIAKLESTTTQSLTNSRATPLATSGSVARARSALDLERNKLQELNRKQTVIDEAVRVISEEIARFVRTHSRPPGYRLDLHGVRFIEADFTKVDFGDANLADAVFEECIFSEADLGETPLRSSTWTSTAWWKAKRISGPLLENLEKYVPFDTNSTFAGSTSLADYDRDIMRLKSVLSDPPKAGK